MEFWIGLKCFLKTILTFNYVQPVLINILFDLLKIVIDIIIFND